MPKPKRSPKTPPSPPPALSKVMAYLGAKGGAAGTGSAKARTTEQARAAITARWDRERAKKKPPSV